MGHLPARVGTTLPQRPLNAPHDTDIPLIRKDYLRVAGYVE